MLEKLEVLTFDLTGIYLTEFRHMPHSRRVVATILFVSLFGPVISTLNVSGPPALDFGCCNSRHIRFKKQGSRNISRYFGRRSHFAGCKQ